MISFLKNVMNCSMCVCLLTFHFVVLIFPKEKSSVYTRRVTLLQHRQSDDSLQLLFRWLQAALPPPHAGGQEVEIQLGCPGTQVAWAGKQQIRRRGVQDGKKIQEKVWRTDRCLTLLSAALLLIAAILTVFLTITVERWWNTLTVPALQ